jgi:ankyrin repeat protein
MFDSLKRWRAKRLANRTLREAVRRGDADAARAALAEGATPDQIASWDGSLSGSPSLLLWVSREGTLEMARVLLENRADISDKDHPWERTCAHYLASRQTEETAMDTLRLLVTLHPKALDARARMGVKTGVQKNHAFVSAWKELSATHAGELRALIEKNELQAQLDVLNVAPGSVRRRI